MLATDQSRLGDQGLTLLLAAITAVSPLVMQMYLPALPSIGLDLGSDPKTTQLTFSAFVFTVGPAQLLYGPIADHFGRRNTAIASLLLSLVGSIACAMACGIGWLVAARVVQALGSAGGMVISRAILSDKFGSDGMAARLSSVIAVIVVVPMLAPLIGGYLTEWFGWRSVFTASAILITMVLVTTMVLLPETRVRALNQEPFIDGTLSLIRKPQFLIYALQSALSLSVFYSFIAIVPFIMESTLNQPPTAYGRFFVLLAGGYMTGIIISSRLASRLGILRMIQIGSSLALLFSIVLFAIITLSELSAWRLFVPMSLLAIASGISSPSMQSGAVLQSKHYAGTASGLVGCAQQLGAGLAIQLIALWGLSSPTPLVVFALAANALTFAAMLMLTRIGNDSASGQY